MTTVQHSAPAGNDATGASTFSEGVGGRPSFLQGGPAAALENRHDVTKCQRRTSRTREACATPGRTKDGAAEVAVAEALSRVAAWMLGSKGWLQHNLERTVHVRLSL